MVTRRFKILKLFLKLFRLQVALVNHRLKGSKPVRQPRPLLKPSSKEESVRLQIQFLLSLPTLSVKIIGPNFEKIFAGYTGLRDNRFNP